MPELPDVETFRRYFAAKALHQPVEHVRVNSPRLLRGTTPSGLGRALVGHRFERTSRHGKYLFGALENGNWLVLHFGMSGRLVYFEHVADRPSYMRVLIRFANGFHLAYDAPRKLGRVALTDAPETFVEREKLGPDALTLGFDKLAAIAAQRRGSLKALLLDQHAIAGLGNIYGDEVLFHARLHPGRSPPSLSSRELVTLHGKIGHVLERAIAAQADPKRMPRTWLLRHRAEGARCPRCHQALRRSSIGGRTGWHCPSCQRAGAGAS